MYNKPHFKEIANVKGRKRHILVDNMGLLLRGLVHAADIQDRDGAKPFLEAYRSKGVRIIVAGSVT